MVSWTLTPTIRLKVKQLLTSGLPNSVAAAASWSRCSGCGLWVSVEIRTLSVSVTVRVMRVRRPCRRPATRRKSARPCAASRRGATALAKAQHDAGRLQPAPSASPMPIAIDRAVADRSSGSTVAIWPSIWPTMSTVGTGRDRVTHQHRPIGSSASPIRSSMRRAYSSSSASRRLKLVIGRDQRRRQGRRVAADRSPLGVRIPP